LYSITTLCVCAIEQSATIAEVLRWLANQLIGDQN
jgi:hypothetical protein